MAEIKTKTQSKEEQLLIQLNREKRKNQRLTDVLLKVQPYIAVAKRNDRGAERLYQEIDATLAPTS